MSSEIQLIIVSTILLLMLIHIGISILDSISKESNIHSDYDGDSHIWTKEKK